MGTAGTISYAGVQPSAYPDGGSTGHNRAYANDFWSPPTVSDDLLFRVEMVPEPSSAGAAVVAAALTLRRRARR